MKQILEVWVEFKIKAEKVPWDISWLEVEESSKTS